MARQLYRRYIWLIDIIRSSPSGITFEEINRKWECSSLNDSGVPMPKRTFHSHINAIFDEFDIEISCDRADGYRYRIENEINEYGSIRSSIVDSLVLGNVVSEVPSMRNKVLLDTAFFPKNLGIVLKAIARKCVLEIRRVYDIPDGAKESLKRKTGMEFKPQDDRFEVEPYATVFHGYWFLVCRGVADGELCVFAVDRLSGIRELDRTFKYPEDFDVKRYVDSFDTDNYYSDRLGRGEYIHDDMDSFALCLIGRKGGLI